MSSQTSHAPASAGALPDAPELLAQSSASDLLAALHSGRISSVTLLDLLHDQYRVINPALNAIVATWWEEAREQAMASDQEREALRERGLPIPPLHGLPMTVKETWEVAGHPATAAAPMWRNHRARSHADLVKRLVAAGAILFGKTNVPVLASDWQSFNPVYGVSHNPWDLSRTPGGSSGGAAAAVAAGLTPLELGSDLAGSIRLPAHYCGIFGHKASHGLLSMRGHVPGPPGTVSQMDLTVAGPMARTAEDLELALEVLAGPPVPDRRLWSPHLPAPSSPECPDLPLGQDPEALRGLRVLWFMEDDTALLDQSLARQYAALRDTLESHGARVSTRLPAELRGSSVIPLYLYLLGAFMSASLPLRERIRLQALTFLDRTFKLQGSARRMPRYFEQFARGLWASHRSWILANERRTRLQYLADEVFAQHDLILMPVTPSTAPLHNHAPMARRTFPVNHREEPYLHVTHWISLASLLGLPATSAPVGLDASGLPLGLQVIGARGDDRRTIRAAGCISRAAGWHARPPGNLR